MFFIIVQQFQFSYKECELLFLCHPLVGDWEVLCLSKLITFLVSTLCTLYDDWVVTLDVSLGMWLAIQIVHVVANELQIRFDLLYHDFAGCFLYDFTPKRLLD